MKKLKVIMCIILFQGKIMPTFYLKEDLNKYISSNNNNNNKNNTN